MPIPRSRSFLLALAASLAAALPAAGQRGTITVTGVAVDSATQGAVLNAVAGTTTRREHAGVDSLGAFRLTLPAGRPYMVTVGAPGFQPIGQVIDGSGDVDLGRVELPPMVYTLAPVNVTLSLLDQRLRGTPLSTRLFSGDLLERSTEQDLLQFLAHRVPLRPAGGCNFLSSGGGCVRVRGYPRAPVVYIDEAPAPSGLMQLTIFRPADVARVEVYQGGMMIWVYTRGYLEMMERTHKLPMPLLPTK
jgi:hypothetical protein